MPHMRLKHQQIALMASDQLIKFNIFYVRRCVHQAIPHRRCI